MSGVELALGVVGVIELAGKMIQQCHSYKTKVKKAYQECEEFLSSVRKLIELLENIKETQSENPLGVESSLGDWLAECHGVLTELSNNRIFDIPTRESFIANLKFKAKWPFHKEKVEEAISKIESIKSCLSLAFDAHQDKLLRLNDFKMTYGMLRQNVAVRARFDLEEEKDRPRYCHPGTRVTLLEELVSWCRDGESAGVFWMNGMAGTGKSTVARTLCRKLQEHDDMIVLSFFFKRGENDRRSCAKFAPTIADQLWNALPNIRKHIKNEIDHDSNVFFKPLENQLESLIFTPLQKYNGSCTDRRARTVLVIDALDECALESDIAILLSSFLDRLDLDRLFLLKIFITSRPEQAISHEFEYDSVSTNRQYETIALQEIPMATIKEDIYTYFKYELDEIRKKFNQRYGRHGQILDKKWPGEENCGKLVDMAFPLFVFAAVICRFLEDYRSNPQTKLEKVLEKWPVKQGSRLETTYLPVLDQFRFSNDTFGFERRRPEDFQEILDQFYLVVGTIVILQDPLSPREISLLMDIPLEGIRDTLRPLNSVLQVGKPSDNMPVRLFHLSFRDFLLDKTASREFWVHEETAHERVAGRCLTYLSESVLTKDNIRSCHPGLSPNYISQDKIRSVMGPAAAYATLYWPQHVRESGRELCDGDQVHLFMTKHFLHWLEALSAIGRVSDAVAMMKTLMVQITKDVRACHNPEIVPNISYTTS